jgi:small subunit ribosomal protein S1
MNNQITWDELKDTLKIGELVAGTVLRHEPFGVFVDVGYGYDGLIQITDFKDEGVMTPDEYPAIGKKIQAVVLGFKDRGRQIWLGVKPSQLEAQ